MTRTPKIDAIRAHELFKATGGDPVYIRSVETNKDERFVDYANGTRLGPFLTLPAYKRAAVTAYVQRFRVVPSDCV
jgi:hypothetical protein